MNCETVRRAERGAGDAQVSAGYKYYLRAAAPCARSACPEQLRRHQAEIAIAAVVWHELWFGCYRLPLSARRAAIEKYFNEVVAVSIPILPYDLQAAAWHATERARLVGVGQTPPFADGQIIAIAKRNDLALVTANLSDYAAFQGVRIENWRTNSPST